MGLSKNKIKYIQSLKSKKGREEHKVFVIEGNKAIIDLLPYMRCQLLIGTTNFLEAISDNASAEEVLEVTDEEISKTSFLKTPQQALAVFYQPEAERVGDISAQLSLALDGVQDPGNMGTIIRLADWYGIQHIFCSKDTVDVYNPKVVQATMGAIARVRVHYIDLPLFLEENKSSPIYGTFLDGEDIYTLDISPNGIIVMGNEGNGVREDVAKLINKRIFIPNYPKGSMTSESLNVAVATAIVCAEFRRRSF